MRSIIRTKLFIFCIFVLSLVSVANGQTIRPDPVATVGVTFAHILWQTSTASDSRVDYGTTTGYGSNVTSASSVTWHKLTITGLSANTTYHYKVTSGSTESSDFTFTTYADPTGVIKTVGSGRTYSTISSCASAADAGDTCLIYSGDFDETVTMGKSGSAGNYITFLAQESCTVNAFNTNGYDYIAIKGLHFDSSKITISSSDYILIENNYITSSSQGILATNAGLATYITIKKNTMRGTGASAGIYANGSYWLIDQNHIVHHADYISPANISYSTVRGNVFHDSDATELGTSEHLDGIQRQGGDDVPANFLLYEKNYMFDTTGQAHYFQWRGTSGMLVNNAIVRYGYTYNIDNCVTVDGYTTNGRFYNNTFRQTTTSDYGLTINQSTDTGYKQLNNIYYGMSGGIDTPYYAIPTFTSNYNVAYKVGLTSWANPYASEGTYLTLRNLNPTFSGTDYSPAISSGSPVIDVGSYLTTVASGDSGSGTTLIVNDSRWFWYGFGIVDADWIAVGTVSNIVQISSINYDTNTITLAGSVSRSSGDPVWLYKDSNGTVVLYGSAPDIGAYEYNPSVTPPSATGCTISGGTFR